jgi:hypothetical protein
MAYYCTRQTGRKDKNGNKEQCGGEIDKSTNKCDTCGAKSS